MDKIEQVYSVNIFLTKKRWFKWKQEYKNNYNKFEHGYYYKPMAWGMGL